MKKFNKDESFENLLIRFNSQPNVKESLKEFYWFLKTHFSFDFLGLLVFIPGQAALRSKAFINEQDALLIDEAFPLSSQGQKQVEKTIEEKIIFFDAHQTVVIKDFVSYMGITTYDKICSLAMVTEIGPSQYGAVGLVSLGEGKNLQKQADILKGFYNPLSSLVRQLFSQIEMTSLKEQLTLENQQLLKRLGFLRKGQIIGSESGLKAVMNQLERVAPLDSQVLILGETGVGKEVVANAIHRLSSRADKPFISINCGAIPETLLDSELFGYEKGAFTGAMNLKRGYFEQADEGTIFLDEVGELSLGAQVKLLRLLQGLAFQRVGGSRPISINVRVIAATNRDLRVAIREQKFRKDLWFRLSVFPIHIPPLRERKEDIPVLAEYFMDLKSAEMNLPFKSVFAEEAMKQLQAYDWPGNVRELQNVLERALILSQGNPLSFPNLEALPNGATEDNAYDETGRILTLDEVFIRHIQKCLMVTRWQLAGPGGAAELLGLHPSTLRGKMRKLGLHLKHPPKRQDLPG